MKHILGSLDRIKKRNLAFKPARRLTQRPLLSKTKHGGGFTQYTRLHTELQRSVDRYEFENLVTQGQRRPAQLLR